jgi:hypothetical protein
MKISLLTRKPGILTLSFLKEKARLFLGKKSGPLAVLESLERGLAEADCTFSVNDKIFEMVHVISGVETLRYAIELKKKGIIKTLIAGPAIVVFPEDADKIILDKNIDVIVFPSKWTKDFFCSRYPELQNKIEIWPAGVKDPGEPQKKNDRVLVFYKNNRELLDRITGFLDGRVGYDIVEYGRFRQDDYYKLLDSHKCVVYVSESESQGIVLQEAWVRGVPTYIWNRRYWEANGVIWKDDKISAPYLSDECGLFFKDFEDFKANFFNFYSRIFSPRKYCLENLIDEKSAEIFINIIKKYDK